MHKFKILLFALFTLCGCSTIDPYELSESRPRASFPSEYGIVSGVFTTPERWRYSRDVFLRNTVTRAEYRISQSFAFAAGNYVSPDRKGVVFALALPPGEYEFFNYQIYSTNAIYENRWFSKEDFSLAFEVAPASVTYFGDIRFVPGIGKNVIGMSVASGGFFTIEDNSEVDIPQLKAAFPDIDWTQASKGNLFGTTLPPIMSPIEETFSDDVSERPMNTSTH